MLCVFWVKKLLIIKIYIKMHWRKWKIHKLAKSDKEFPKALKKLSKVPEQIFFRGDWNQDIFDKTISIVGSRRMTRYGKEVVEKFVPEIVAKKVTVISGFMYGVDCQSHWECLNNGGKTIAVLGGGLDYLTPAENDEMYTKILESGGLVISEYEPKFCPTLWSFPQRNRIVAALATEGILVVEAGMKSGSLITARLGSEMKKKVYAVPGPIFSGVSAGTNWLIKENKARMITGIEEVLGDKMILIQEDLFMNSMSEIELKIYKLLKNEALTADEMVKKLHINIVEVSIATTSMSMNGYVREEAGTYFLA